MKRVLSISTIIVIISVFLTSCMCNHQWLQATCNSPMICENCGDINGSPLSHIWIDPTCNTPYVCSLCGAQKGAPLEHRWTNSSCEQQAICEYCEEKGEFGDHDWLEATSEHARKCKTCGLTDGLPTLSDGDERYIVASCAYRAIFEEVFVPSSMIIERAKYAKITEDVPYFTVVLECSAENALGGRALVRCYAYRIPSRLKDIDDVLPAGGYYTFDWKHGDAIIYCRVENVTRDNNDVSFYNWESLIPDLIMEQYNQSFN